jgi:4'-phosphopantetheinyl transferase
MSVTAANSGADPRSRRAALPAGAVAVWRIPAAVAAAVAGYLDDAERQRAAALRRVAARQLFIAHRGAQRTILAGYLGCTAADVRFAYAEHGKPAVAGAPLHFSASRRGELALVAVARDRALGIDVEGVRPLPDLDAVIRATCTAAEQAALQVLNPAARLHAFYRCWTGKEAYLKLHGWGLTVEPGTIGVHAADLLESRTGWAGGGPAANPAHLTWPSVAPGYVAALAVEGAPPAVCAYDFMPAAPQSNISIE